MKRLYLPTLTLLTAALLSIGTVQGQEVDYTQYYLNLPGINPGFTGMDDFLSMKLGYRQGWNGYGVNNNNVFISAYGALGVSSNIYLQKNGLRISNLETLENLRPAKRMRRRQGIGGMASSRTVGPYTSVNASGNYAYHLPLSDKLSLSFGTRLSYSSQRIDVNSFTLRNPVSDAFYQQLMQSNPGNINSMAADFGSALYSDRFYFGVSTANLVVKSLSGDGSLYFNTARQYSLQTAVNFPIGPALVVSPGGKLTHDELMGLTWTVNGRVRIKDVVYVGGGYSSTSKMSFLFGLALGRNYTINYSYDHYLPGVGALNVNVHEVVLGLAAFNKFDSRGRLW